MLFCHNKGKPGCVRVSKVICDGEEGGGEEGVEVCCMITGEEGGEGTEERSWGGCWLGYRDHGWSSVLMS